MKSEAKKEIRSTIITICIVIIAFIISKYIFSTVIVQGKSMEPNYKNNNLLLINRTPIYTPKRFDVVVFKFKNITLIKRVIGIPGDTVYINKNGNILINGKILKENYGKEIIQIRGDMTEPIKLKSEEYFVLGDNRNRSLDSRFKMVGNIKQDKIIGVVFYKLVGKTTLF